MLKMKPFPWDPCCSWWSFLGHIKARSVSHFHHQSCKHSISKVEGFKDPTNTCLFLTQYSQSPMANADKITILSCTGRESMPQEALAIVAQMLVSKQSTWSLEGGGWLASLQSLIQHFQRSNTVHLFYFSFHNVSIVGGKCTICSKSAIMECHGK